MPRVPIFCAAAVAVLALASPAGAQTARQAILARLDSASAAPASRGYTVDASALGRPSLVGRLPRDGSVSLEINLRAGRKYRIVAGCGDGCDDLDLRAFAADGDTRLDEDVEPDELPVLAFTADHTGPHLLSVDMASCRADFCYFGFRVLSR